MKTILVFCAHSDDEAIGMSGTIAKYVDKKYDIIKVVLSFGEKSHPHMREDVLIEKRVGETKKASEMIGIKETLFLGLRDTHIKDEMKDPEIAGRIKKIIVKFRPEKIFCPTSVDNHPTKDHRATNLAVLKAVDKLKTKYDVYGYEIWDVWVEDKPQWYVDITPYFKKKLEYIRKFRSQWQYMYGLLLPVFFRNRYYGWKNKCKYAERFYKFR